jgi:hypothetical protein
VIPHTIALTAVNTATVLHIDNHTWPPQAMLATEHPIGKHELAGNFGGQLHNESDPKRPDIFDDWQHQ